MVATKAGATMINWLKLNLFNLIAIAILACFAGVWWFIMAKVAGFTPTDEKPTIDLATGMIDTWCGTGKPDATPDGSPVGKLTPAVLYPEIDRGVEYRFELYRAKNVSGVAQDVFNIFDHLANKAPVRATQVGAVCQPLALDLNMLVVEFGDMLKRCSSPSV